MAHAFRGRQPIPVLGSHIHARIYAYEITGPVPPRKHPCLPWAFCCDASAPLLGLTVHSEQLVVRSHTQTVKYPRPPRATYPGPCGRTPPYPHFPRPSARYAYYVSHGLTSEKSYPHCDFRQLLTPRDRKIVVPPINRIVTTSNCPKTRRHTDISDAT